MVTRSRQKVRKKPLPILFEDVIREILCLCDIATVLTASLVSRTFHALAMSKEVWLSLLSDLYRRGFIDVWRGQGLNALSPCELVDLAKHTTCGPTSWSTRYPVSVNRRIVSPEVHTAHGSSRIRKLQLLPGGRFLLSQTNYSIIECWETVENRHIWRYNAPCAGVTAKVWGYAAELIDDGQAVMIVVGTCRSGTHGSLQDFLEVVRLDLNTGLSKSVLTESVPDTGHNHAVRRLKIQGDFIIMSVRSRERMKLIQVSTAKSIDIKVSGRCFDITFVPGHVVVFKPRTPHGRTYDLNIWSVRALLAYHTPDAALGRVKPIVSKGIDTSSIPNPKVYLESHISPLRDDVSTVWAIVLSCPDQCVEPRTVVHKFCVTHPPSQRLSVASVLSWKFASGIYKRGTTPDTLRVAFTGFLPTCFENETGVGFIALARAELMALPFEAGEDVAFNKSPYLSPYDGTAMFRSKNLRSVVIHQYN